MKTKLSKKIGRRGKIGLAVLIAFMFIGVASAGILSHYNTITTTANVRQSILVDGKDVNTPVTDSFDVTGGCTVCKSHWIKNNACIDGTVSLDTTITGPGGSDGVTVTYMDSVHLENKDPSTWAIIADGMEADVTFGLVGEEFAYMLEATGLQPSVEYVLIYYADQQDRFVDWGGDNPGAILGTFTADGAGAISYSYSLNIGMNMPHADDWNNAPPADYTGGSDNYAHKTGAKIWLIPSADYDAGTKALSAWNPSTYLFETELIRYFDNAVNEITIPSGEFIDFEICHDFDIAIIPGTYTITTTVSPK